MIKLYTINGYNRQNDVKYLPQVGDMVIARNGNEYGSLGVDNGTQGIVVSDSPLSVWWVKARAPMEIFDTIYIRCEGEDVNIVRERRIVGTDKVWKLNEDHQEFLKALTEKGYQW